VCLLQLTWQFAALIKAVENGYKGVEDLPLHPVAAAAPAAVAVMLPAFLPRNVVSALEMRHKHY
jgi:hypothetical protein